MNAAAAMAIVELRQYTLLPSRRDALIALFEDRFVDAQRDCGAPVLGSFRDLDDPQRFVWLRGFASMAARHDALTTFYGGPVWQAHRAAANATMRDSGNVLLLRPVAAERVGSAGAAAGTCLALIHDVRHVNVADFVFLFDAMGRPMLAAGGAMTTTCFVTEASPNTFDRLPVRVAERVHVCIASFDSVAALDAVARTIGPANALRDAASDALLPAFMRRPEVLRMAATARSMWG